MPTQLQEDYGAVCSRALGVACAGAIGALLGWASLEPWFQDGGVVGRFGLANAFLYPVSAGTAAAAMAMAESFFGARVRDAASFAVAGFGVSFVAAYALLVPARFFFAWLTNFDVTLPVAGVEPSWERIVLARCVSWGIMGIAFGLHAAVRVRGLSGVPLVIASGLASGVVAGLIFDPAQSIFREVGYDSGWIARSMSLTAMGALVGFFSAAGLIQPRPCLPRVARGAKAGLPQTVLLDS